MMSHNGDQDTFRQPCAATAPPQSYNLSSESSDGGLSSSSSESSHKSEPNYNSRNNQGGVGIDFKITKPKVEHNDNAEIVQQPRDAFDTSRLEEDLLKLDHNFSANRLFDSILGYSSHSGSSSEAESMFFDSSADSMIVKSVSYTSSCDWEPRGDRHSWAGQLEIINVGNENEKSEQRAKRRDNRKRQDSEANSHHQQANGTVKSAISSKGSKSPANSTIDTFTFESQPSVFTQVVSNLPLLRHFLKGKSVYTQMRLSQDTLQIRFITTRDLSCSRRWTSKSKITILLVDITNIYIFNETNTIVIQFSKCDSKTASKHLKYHTTLNTLTSTSKPTSTSKLQSLDSSKPFISQSLSGTPNLELELRGFNNSPRIVRLILDKRQELLPKSIMKRSSVKGKKLRPMIVPAPVDIIECVSYI